MGKIEGSDGVLTESRGCNEEVCERDQYINFDFSAAVIVALM